MILTKIGNKYLIHEAKYSDTVLLGKDGARFAFDKTGNKTGYEGTWWTPQIAKASKLVDYADETCKEELEGYLVTQTSRVKRSRSVDSNFEVPVPPGIVLRGYQRGGVELLLDTPYALLGDQMGLGKTPMCLVTLNGLVGGQAGVPGQEHSGGDTAESRVNNCLVVCPASLRFNWRSESGVFLEPAWEVHLLDSTSDLEEARRKCQQPDRVVFVCSPEAIVSKSNYKVSKEAGEITRGPVDEFIHSIEWDMVIVDEAHMLKNPKAKRTVALLGRDGSPPRGGKHALPAQPAMPPIRAKRAILATGTPYPNCPIEVQPLAGFCHKEFKSYWEFAAKYADMKRTRFGMEVKGASNLHMLQERLRSTILIRRTKDEVLTDLPPKVRQVIDLPDTGMAKFIKAEQGVVKDQLKVIQQLRTLTPDTIDKAKWKESVKTLKNNLQVSFREMAKLRSATALAKVSRCAEYIHDQLETGAIEKVGIFAHHRPVVEGMQQALAAFGSVKYYGGMSQANKHAAYTKFMEDPACRVFVGSIGAAGVGLTLTAASDVFFVELDWVPGNMEQAEDRFHRITQKSTVFVRHLVVDGSIDSKMAHRLVSKQASIDAGLDDNRALDTLFGLGYDEALNYSDKELESIYLGLKQVIQE